MKPSPFQYFCPTTVVEALQLLAWHGDAAKVIAGGQSLVPMMNFRLAKPEILIDINRLAEFDFHRVEGQTLHIGALARHAALLASSTVRQACPLMSDAYKRVAHGTVRNRGTLCGNLCHADPASEMPAVMLAYGASMVLRSERGERVVSAADFFQGLYATAVKPDELLVEVRIPIPTKGIGHSFKGISVRKGDFALTLVASMMRIQDGRIKEAVLAYGGISDRPRRFGDIEKLLIGATPSEALFTKVAANVAALINPSADIHADSEYRRDLVRTLTVRTLTEASVHVSGNT